MTLSKSRKPNNLKNNPQKNRPWLLAGVLLLAALAVGIIYLNASPGQNNPGPLAFFCSAEPVDVPEGLIDPMLLGEYEYKLIKGSCRQFAEYASEISQTTNQNEEDATQQVCLDVQEALMSSLISVEKFDGIQYIITGDSQALRAYNMDVYTSNCDAP